MKKKNARPITSREYRTACASRNHGNVFAPLNKHIYCADCGALFISTDDEILDDPIDWQATAEADIAELRKIEQNTNGVAS